MNNNSCGNQTNLSTFGQKLLSRFLQDALRQPTADRRVSFREFVARVAPHYQWYKHCEVLGDVLQRVADGELSRVMIFMPPRHGKSELTSRLFSAYYLHCHPERWVGLCSYTGELAHGLSRNAKDYYCEAGHSLKLGARAAKGWETGAGGGMWASGVGGSITGKGWHLGIIDDPVKGALQANSPKLRNRQREWYQSSFLTREEAVEGRTEDGSVGVWEAGRGGEAEDGRMGGWEDGGMGETETWGHGE